jgi:hypothetical protein
MKQIKTTPDFLPLNSDIKLTREQLIELYHCVFNSIHSEGFMSSEMKDLLFKENYWFMESRKDGWEEFLKDKLKEFGII